MLVLVEKNNNIHHMKLIDVYMQIDKNEERSFIKTYSILILTENNMHYMKQINIYAN